MTESIPKILSNIESVGAQKLLEEFLNAVSVEFVINTAIELNFVSLNVNSRIRIGDLALRGTPTVRSRRRPSSRDWCGRSWNQQNLEFQSLTAEPTLPLPEQNGQKSQQIIPKFMRLFRKHIFYKCINFLYLLANNSKLILNVKIYIRLKKNDIFYEKQLLILHFESNTFWTLTALSVQ